MSVNKEDVITKIGRCGVIPVFYHADMDILLRILTLSYQSGLRVFEFMHQRDNKGLRFFEHLVACSGDFPDLTLGVGTVLDATMTERYIGAGAHFIASPFLRPDMGQVCKKNKILWMPGCTTSEEIDKAESLGAKAINVLPGNILGHEFIAATSKLHPNLHLVPSGIIDLREPALTKWFESGVLAIKLGNQVFTKEDITNANWTKIEKNLRQIITHINKIQSVLKLTH